MGFGFPLRVFLFMGSIETVFFDLLGGVRSAGFSLRFKVQGSHQVLLFWSSIVRRFMWFLYDSLRCLLRFYNPASPSA